MCVRWDDTFLPFSGNSCRPFGEIRRFWGSAWQISSYLDGYTNTPERPFGVSAAAPGAAPAHAMHAAQFLDRFVEAAEGRPRAVPEQLDIDALAH
jgi:hypothetical protein